MRKKRPNLYNIPPAESTNNLARSSLTTHRTKKLHHLSTEFFELNTTYMKRNERTYFIINGF